MQLKRYISTLLSALILFSNIGLAFNVHYCHGQVSAVTVAYKTDHCGQKQAKKVKTCCAKAAAEKKCCKNHLVKLQDKTDKAPAKSLHLDLASFYIAPDYKLPFEVYDHVASAKKDVPAFYTESNAPPLYKLYCQYIFYA